MLTLHLAMLHGLKEENEAVTQESHGTEAQPPRRGRGSTPTLAQLPRLTVQLGLTVMFLAKGSVAGLRACPHLDQVAGSPLQPAKLGTVF